MSVPGQERWAWESCGPSYPNQTLPSGGHHYGNIRKVYAAGQSGKRMRSSSNEDYSSRVSQVQVWLNDATAEEFEKVWAIFSESTASSSTQAYGSTAMLYPESLEDIDLVPDTLSHSSTSAEPVLTSGLSSSVGFSQNPGVVEPKNSIHNFTMFSSAETTSTLSGVPQSEHYYSTLPSPSQSHLHSRDSEAVETTRLMMRESLIKSKQDRTRDAVQSTNSYNSMNSDTISRWNSKHSSTSSLGSQSISSLRKASQKSMHMSLKKSHSRSSSGSRPSNTIQTSEIQCTHPGCTSTFKRDPDRARHEDVFHSNKVGYTCLLHTCSQSCSTSCGDEMHSSPYSNGRPDKMKEHLVKVHNWSIRVSQIPKAFRHRYERHQRGWVCSTCGVNLGSWHDDCDNFQGHESNCEALLRTSFKRMSVEEPGVDGAWKGGDMEKGWPLSGKWV